MARLCFQFWPFETIATIVYCQRKLIFFQILNMPSKNCQRLFKFVEVTKFRQIWSHWYQNGIVGTARLQVSFDSKNLIFWSLIDRPINVRMMLFDAIYKRCVFAKRCRLPIFCIILRLLAYFFISGRKLWLTISQFTFESCSLPKAKLQEFVPALANFYSFR